MRPLSPPLWWRPLGLGLCLWALGAAVLSAQAPAGPLPSFPADADTVIPSREQLLLTLTRLPLAAALGTVLALRPRRRGTPVRTPAVVETQIMLAGIGALIMLIVGASLARAFGIVGAASLIRYRSKIDDPKDAVVMLGALAVGLASGVGLYVLATIATGFLVVVLWVTESFEPRSFKHFDLSIKAQGQAEALEPKIEQVLRRYRLPFEVRALSADELSYDVQVPLDKATDPISHAIVELAPKADVGVVWEEKKPVKK
jgi:uncharacterized membrane protein YhiD involved in acid resistance